MTDRDRLRAEIVTLRQAVSCLRSSSQISEDGQVMLDRACEFMADAEGEITGDV